MGPPMVKWTCNYRGSGPAVMGPGNLTQICTCCGGVVHLPRRGDYVGPGLIAHGKYTWAVRATCHACNAGFEWYTTNTFARFKAYDGVIYLTEGHGKPLIGGEYSGVRVHLTLLDALALNPDEPVPETLIQGQAPTGLPEGAEISAAQIAQIILRAAHERARADVCKAASKPSKRDAGGAKTKEAAPPPVRPPPPVKLDSIFKRLRIPRACGWTPPRR